MLTKSPHSRAEKRRNPRPLDAPRLQELALAYVARFASSAAKLEGYLKRKVRERGWDGEESPPIAALVSRFVEAGYVDDAAYAKAKTGSLLRRGYGMQRVSQSLNAAGIAEDVRAELRPGEAAQRQAALAFIRKRKFGPFATDAPDRAVRQKQLAAMLRAGHPLDSARELIEATSVDSAAAWADALTEREEDVTW